MNFIKRPFPLLSMVIDILFFVLQTVLHRVLMCLKRQQREIFVLWFYSSIDPTWAPVYFTTFVSSSVSNLPSFSNSKFELCNGPLQGTKFFLQIPRILNLSGVGPCQHFSIQTHFQNHCPFKGYGKLIKTVVQFCATVISFALWPIAQNQMLRHSPQHNQILRYGLQCGNSHRFLLYGLFPCSDPQHITKYTTAAHSV